MQGHGRWGGSKPQLGNYPVKCTILGKPVLTAVLFKEHFEPEYETKTAVREHALPNKKDAISHD